MKKLQKIILLLVVFLLCGLSSVAKGADEQLGLVVDGSLLTDRQEVSTDTRSNARGTYLSYGSATLSNLGNHVVNMWGSTTCYKTSDQVKVTLSLQRLVNGSWTTIKTLNTKIAYNTNYVSKSQDVTVTGGYYYRIKGTHTAVKGKTVETTSSSTDGLWISK